MATFHPAQIPFSQGYAVDPLAPPSSAPFSSALEPLSMSAPLSMPSSSLPQAFYAPQPPMHPPTSSAAPASHPLWPAVAPAAVEATTLPDGTLTPSAAVSAARLRLHYLQRSARAEGEREFERGVGARTRADDHALGRGRASDAVARRRRKTRSAYVSRYAAKQYARLLEEHVASADATVTGLRVRVAEDERRITAAKELLASIEARTSGALVSTQVRETAVWGTDCQQANVSDVSDCALAGMGETTAAASYS